MIDFVEFLSEFAYRRIVIGTALIGACSGAMGAFLYLRRQSLMSDVIGHSATPGVMGAFLLVSAVSAGFDARSMPVIVVGALVTGLLSVVLANRVADTTRIGIDATMAVTLSLFLGGGLLLLQVIQRSRIRGKGGIEELMFGNAATLTNLDVYTIAVVTVLVAVVTAVLWRPFTVITFDPVLATVAGTRLKVLSPVLFGLVVLAIVMGVKAVGLILMIAFAVFPPAAARQFSKTVGGMVLLSGVFGVVAAVVGSYFSVALGKVPTGPMIVVVLSVIVVVSMIVAPKRSGVHA
ncbi:Manganese transport system membrane protein MntB [Corynebacterium felinum]|uniref:Manganese/zinc/iron transport system permease protein n=1 Tax=Corynebacterium felinum TaxID=131318 RepID=A0ABU2B726_9CORY|nr:manganese/zinc/iron transport system permease protein [Corynebacterium felinum]WJY93787.1 Manganese transport system membrane protein MntB [Corynebacterium felinum]